MRKFILLTSVLSSLFTASSTSAAVLSPEDALARVAKTSSSFNAPARIKKSVPVFTAEADGVAACYVFCNQSGDGYIVVSADDLAPALLGYADDGAFDVASMPPSLRYWLESYSKQIEWLRDNKQQTSTSAVERPERAEIAPLVKTLWNQDAPYNDMCPQSSGERCVTGCVATALAQVMNYHRYPVNGSGSNSYQWNGETLQVDFASTTYDWDNMLDEYSSSATDAQKSAVATLMYSCGVAVNMEYGTSESSSMSVDVPTALVNYFGYDKGVQYLSREYYGLSDWEDLLYNQLKDYGPVQYSGQSSEGGHSFVCDGYSTDGYFHFNWGWGGLSNGYFLLTALNPESQGIGGSTSGFNFDQDIIANVKPSSGDDTYNYMMSQQGDFAIAQQSAELGSAITVEASIFNLSVVAMTGELGVKITSAVTGQSVYADGVSFTNLARLKGYSRFTVTLPSQLAVGEYVITPAFKVSDGEWQDVQTPVSGVRSVNMSVSGQTATFTASENASVKISNVSPQTPFYIGKSFYIKADVENISSDEFYGTVCVALFDENGNMVALGEEFPLDVTAGDTMAMDYVSSFSFGSGTTPDAGEYFIAFATPSLSESGEYSLVSAPIAIQLLAAPEETLITVTDMAIADGSQDAVDRNKFSVTATVTCTAGYYSDALTLAVFPYSTSSVSSIATFKTEELFIDEGESKSVTAGGVLSAAEDGKTYMAVFYNGNTQVTSPLIFTIVSTTGISEIETSHPSIYPNPCENYFNVTVPDGVASVTVYSSNGELVLTSRDSTVNTSGIGSGIYIVKITTNGGFQHVERIIKKQ